MKLKLTSQQAEALHYLFEKVILTEMPENIAESLVMDLMKQIFKRLRDKLEAKKKDGYSIEVNDVQAKAFYLYFQNRNLPPGYVYEENLIQTHLNEINRIYA